MAWEAAVTTAARARMRPLNQQARTGQGVGVPDSSRFGQEFVEVRTFASKAPLFS